MKNYHIASLIIFALSSSSMAQVIDGCQECETHKGLTEQIQDFKEVSYAKEYEANLPDRAINDVDVANDSCKNVSPKPKEMKTFESKWVKKIQPDTRAEWLNLTGWVLKTTPKGTEFAVNRKECVVSKFGKGTPTADLVESIELYRFRPMVLENNCPKKYIYLRDHVFHKEFTPKTCG